MRSDLVSAGVFGATTLCWFDTPYITLFVDSMFVILYWYLLSISMFSKLLTNMLKNVVECSNVCQIRFDFRMRNDGIWAHYLTWLLKSIFMLLEVSHYLFT